MATSIDRNMSGSPPLAVLGTDVASHVDGSQVGNGAVIRDMTGSFGLGFAVPKIVVWEERRVGLVVVDDVRNEAVGRDV